MKHEEVLIEAYRRFREHTKSIKCPICQSTRIFYPHEYGPDTKIPRDEAHRIYYVLHCLDCAYEMKFCANEYITVVDIENAR